MAELQFALRLRANMPPQAFAALPYRLSICHEDHVSDLQGALLLPALRYAENGTFTINFWQRVHRRFPDASQYMLSHQSLLPAGVNTSAWGANQVHRHCAMLQLRQW